MAGGSSQPPPGAHAPPPAHGEPAAASSAHAGGAHHAPGAGGVASGCGAPANHCLDADVVFVSSGRFTGRPVSLEPARADAAGGYVSLRSGERLGAEHVLNTRAVAPEELAVGQLVALIDRYHTPGGHALYRVPESRDEAHGYHWWMSRIVGLPVVPGGELILAGGRRSEVGAARLVDGDDMSPLQVTGAKDAHYLRADHWIVSDRPLPKKGHTSAQVAALIQPAARGRDGQFFGFNGGAALWSGNAWRTRIATEADLRVGAHVFMIDRYDTAGGVVYRAPNDRVEALTHSWWIGVIVDTREAYKGVVTVAGGRKVKVEALRVAL